MCDATSNTMMHYGEKAIMKGGKIAFFTVKELIQESDVEEEEINCTKKKFKDSFKSSFLIVLRVVIFCRIINLTIIKLGTLQKR